MPRQRRAPQRRVRSGRRSNRGQMFPRGNALILPYDAVAGPVTFPYSSTPSTVGVSFLQLLGNELSPLRVVRLQAVRVEFPPVAQGEDTNNIPINVQLYEFDPVTTTGGDQVAIPVTEPIDLSYVNPRSLTGVLRFTNFHSTLSTIPAFGIRINTTKGGNLICYIHSLAGCPRCCFTLICFNTSISSNAHYIFIGGV